ncbi:MAG: hypothetical protein M3164_07515 [Actinomycetota bacterium]|nr:hypothetical protein [Actinomycetota bacterium]
MEPVSGWVWFEVLGISVLLVSAVGAGVYFAEKKLGIPGNVRIRHAALTAGILGLWLAVAASFGGAGVFRADAESVPMIGPAVAAPIVLGALALWRSSRLRALLAAVPQQWLLAAQFPRIFGVTFLILMAQGKLPGEFAIPAGYGDILVGVLAPVAAYLYHRLPKASDRIVLGFNLLGAADLAVAVATGFLAAPSPFRVLMTAPSTELVTVLPLVLVPTFLVPSFLLIHVLSLHKQFASQRAARPAAWGKAAAGTAG